MTEKAPERLWIGLGLPGYITDGAWHGIFDIEYVHAGLYEELKAKAEELARLVKQEADCYDPSDSGAEEMYDALDAFRAALGEEEESEMSPVKDREDYEV